MKKLENKTNVMVPSLHVHEKVKRTSLAAGIMSGRSCPGCRRMFKIIIDGKTREAAGGKGKHVEACSMKGLAAKSNAYYAARALIIQAEEELRRVEAGEAEPFPTEGQGGVAGDEPVRPGRSPVAAPRVERPAGEDAAATMRNEMVLSLFDKVKLLRIELRLSESDSVLTTIRQVRAAHNPGRHPRY